MQNPTDEATLQQFFRGELLLSSFNSVLQKLALKATLSPPVRCAIVYAWPVLPEEQSIQEQLLRLVGDLSTAGLDVVMDIVSGSVTTNFATGSQEWIQNSSMVLLIGTHRHHRFLNCTPAHIYTYTAHPITLSPHLRYTIICG
jgi:hypothetical protein